MHGGSVFVVLNLTPDCTSSEQRDRPSPYPDLGTLEAHKQVVMRLDSGGIQVLSRVSCR